MTKKKFILLSVVNVIICLQGEEKYYQTLEKKISHKKCNNPDLSCDNLHFEIYDYKSRDRKYCRNHTKKHTGNIKQCQICDFQTDMESRMILYPVMKEKYCCDKQDYKSREETSQNIIKPFTRG